MIRRHHIRCVYTCESTSSVRQCKHAQSLHRPVFRLRESAREKFLFGTPWTRGRVRFGGTYVFYKNQTQGYFPGSSGETRMNLVSRFVFTFYSWRQGLNVAFQGSIRRYGVPDCE